MVPPQRGCAAERGRWPGVLCVAGRGGRRPDGLCAAGGARWLDAAGGNAAHAALARGGRQGALAARAPFRSWRGLHLARLQLPRILEKFILTAN